MRQFSRLEVQVKCRSANPSMVSARLGKVHAVRRRGRQNSGLFPAEEIRTIDEHVRGGGNRGSAPELARTDGGEKELGVYFRLWEIEWEKEDMPNLLTSNLLWGSMPGTGGRSSYNKQVVDRRR